MKRKSRTTRNFFLAVALIGAGCLILFPKKKAPDFPSLTDEENALDMQCQDKHGLLAMAHGPMGEWISCYQGKKKIWSVRL